MSSSVRCFSSACARLAMQSAKSDAAATRAVLLENIVFSLRREVNAGAVFPQFELKRVERHVFRQICEQPALPHIAIDRPVTRLDDWSAHVPCVRLAGKHALRWPQRHDVTMTHQLVGLGRETLR